MKAVVAAFNQEKALVGAFSVITNLRMELFGALILTNSSKTYHQVGPQIEIKYKLGGKQFIHRASQSVGVRKGMKIDLSISI